MTVAPTRILSACLLLACATSVSAPVAAAEDTVFVTDELRLGLFPDETTDGRPSRMLTSGDELRILERALRSVRVRTEAGDEGWVKTGYVVTEPPARRRIQPLEAENQELIQALDALRTRTSSMEQQLTGLTRELEQARQGIVELPELQREVGTLRQALDAQAHSVHSNWLIAAAIAAFVAGCAAGYYWLDRRVRKRFGGLRVY